MIKLNNVYCGYNGINVINGISYDINKGSNLCILGPNGCGKTTLLKSIGNIIGYKGSITYNNIEISKIKTKDYAKKIAFMHQINSVCFPYTVYEVVSFGRYSKTDGVFGMLSNEDKDIILKSIERVGLINEKDKQISHLSGGQCQKVFMARVFAQEPEVLLLDEPTNHLDLKYKYELLEQVNIWSESSGKTIIYVLHDINLALEFCKTAILIGNGKIIASGSLKTLVKGQEMNSLYKINVREKMLVSLYKWL